MSSLPDILGYNSTELLIKYTHVDSAHARAFMNMIGYFWCHLTELPAKDMGADMLALWVYTVQEYQVGA
jgi:hypothetical protein